MSAQDLEQATGMSRAFVWKLLNRARRGRPIRAETLEQLARAVNVDVGVMTYIEMLSAGYTLPDLVSDDDGWNAAGRKMTRDQRRAVLAFMEQLGVGKE